MVGYSKLSSNLKRLGRSFRRKFSKSAIDVKSIKLIEGSALFESEFYLGLYDDVASGTLAAAKHYYHYGKYENRLPGSWASRETVHTLAAIHSGQENWVAKSAEAGDDVDCVLGLIEVYEIARIEKLITHMGADRPDNIEQVISDFRFLKSLHVFDMNAYAKSASIDATSLDEMILHYLTEGHKQGFKFSSWIPVSAVPNDAPMESSINAYFQALVPEADTGHVNNLVSFISKEASVSSLEDMVGYLKLRETLLNSKHFDANAYVSAANIDPSNTDAALHYALVGERMNVMPNDWFVPSQCYIEHDGIYEEITTRLTEYLTDTDMLRGSLSSEAKGIALHHFETGFDKLAQTLPESRLGLEKLARDYISIAKSDYFDKKYYAEVHAEYLDGWGTDVLSHYVTFGAKSGARPSAYQEVEKYGVPPKNLETEPNPLLLHIKRQEDRDAFIQSVFGGNLEAADYLFLEKLETHSPTLSKVQYENLLADYKLLKFSETLDVELYERLNPDVKDTGLSPLIHFVLQGANEGRWPAEWFNIKEGYEKNPEFKVLKKNPFAEYIRQNPTITKNVKSQAIKFLGGIDELKKEIKSSGLFDADYYKKALNITDKKFDAIGHYLKFGRIYKLTPRGDFDPEWYWATYSDCQELQLDPFVHYVRFGHKQMRSTQAEHVHNTRGSNDTNLSGRIGALLPGTRTPVFEEKRTVNRPADIRCFTWYLPQFHPCAENNEFWGEGFTEWTNVTTALPKFSGHVQPKLPSNFGFYDLRLVNIMRDQAKLAREFHIEGFAFYYYWFGGKRVLDLPVENFLKTPDIDIDFFICWANENWTRRWDGKDQDVLLAQNHSSEDDIAILEDWKRHTDDPRYTRIDGKPVIAIYRPGLIPNLKKSIDRWRAHAIKLGMGELYFSAVNSFGYKDAKKDGFDAWIEFPPHSYTALKDVTMEKDISDDFKGAIYDYDSYVRENETKNEIADLPTFRGAMPSWDNTARKKNNATIFDGATPQKFQKIVAAQIGKLKEQNKAQEQVLIVNAWNEWAEGTYMEPDRANGHANINALGRALTHTDAKCVIISNDATMESLGELPERYAADVLPASTDEAGKSLSVIHQICHYGQALLSYDYVIFSGVDNGPFKQMSDKNLSELVTALDLVVAKAELGGLYLGQLPEPVKGNAAKQVDDIPDHIVMEFMSMAGLSKKPVGQDFVSYKDPLMFSTSALRHFIENAAGIKSSWLKDAKRRICLSYLLLYCVQQWNFKMIQHDLSSHGKN